MSLLGSQVTAFALPLVATMSLGASAAEMGRLTAADLASAVALGLVAGVWIDRRPRRSGPAQGAEPAPLRAVS